MKIVFTSVANNYIPKARILAESLKKFHPDWYFILLIKINLSQSQEQMVNQLLANYSMKF